MRRYATFWAGCIIATPCRSEFTENMTILHAKPGSAGHTSSTGKRVAFFLSADSFEGFYGGIFGLDRNTFLASYRNDFVWEYAYGLRKLGHSVFLYILSYGRPVVHRIEEGLHVRFLPLPLWLRIVEPFTYRLRGVSGLRTLRDRVAYAGYGAALEAALRADRIDVLYHQEIWTPRFDLVLRRVKVPTVGAEHGAVYETWMEKSKRASLGLAAALTCQSLEGIERCRRFGGRPELMYNGVDAEYFTPPAISARRSKTILTVGRLVEQQKRFKDLLHALSYLPEFTLLLVGTGPDEAVLKRLTEELGLRERVRFLGFIADRAELRNLYRESGVFVSSSAWEAVALVVLEAMSCEMPVVCTQIASFEELIQDGVDGLLVPVGDPAAIGRSVRDAFDRSSTLGHNARITVVSRYSSERLYARLSTLIEAASDAEYRTREAEAHSVDWNSRRQ